MTPGKGDRAVAFRIRGATREQHAVAGRRGDPGEAGDHRTLRAQLATGAGKRAEQLDAHARRSRHQTVGGELVREAARRLERRHGLDDEGPVRRGSTG